MAGLLDLVCSTTWAIRPEMLEAIVALVNREDVSRAVVANAAHFSEGRVREAARAMVTQIPIQAVGARGSIAVEGSHNLLRRGSTAIVPVTGTITRYSTLMSSMSGSGQSVETISRDFNRALDDPAFTSILLNIDSPGGESSGIAELADMIYQARSIKPIWAYVSDLGASAAYWIASAAERVIIAETAALGSIGCVAVFRNPAGDKNSTLEFVSSVSPNKRPDLSTEKGRAQIQELVDTLGGIFVDTVARNRGVTSDTVINEYGAGGLKVGKDAVTAGMAEALGSFEGTLAELANQSQPVAPARPMRRAASMGLREKFLELIGDLPVEAQEETTVSASNGQTVVPTPTASALVPSPAPDANAARVAALEAENRRLRLQNHQVQAAAFADRVISEMRAFPGEREHLMALYVQAALDDEHGPGLDGTLRTQLIVNAVAARTSVKHLTAEALSPMTLAAIQTHAAPPKSADAPITPERRAQLHGYSTIGRNLNGSAN